MLVLKIYPQKIEIYSWRCIRACTFEQTAIHKTGGEPAMMKEHTCSAALAPCELKPSKQGDPTQMAARGEAGGKPCSTRTGHKDGNMAQ
jgi:hypothetical protein